MAAILSCRTALQKPVGDVTYTPSILYTLSGATVSWCWALTYETDLRVSYFVMLGRGERIWLNQTFKSKQTQTGQSLLY